MGALSLSFCWRMGATVRLRATSGSAPRLSARRAELPAERTDERPAVDMRGVVGADEDRVVLGRMEREGPDETGMPEQLHAVHDVASHTQAVAVVAQPGLGWERRSRRPAREVLESRGVDDPLRP